jgi:hypothetical protein
MWKNGKYRDKINAKQGKVKAKKDRLEHCFLSTLANQMQIHTVPDAGLIRKYLLIWTIKNIFSSFCILSTGDYIQYVISTQKIRKLCKFVKNSGSWIRTRISNLIRIRIREANFKIDLSREGKYHFWFFFGGEGTFSEREMEIPVFQCKNSSKGVIKSSKLCKEI